MARSSFKGIAEEIEPLLVDQVGNFQPSGSPLSLVAFSSPLLFCAFALPRSRRWNSWQFGGSYSSGVICTSQFVSTLVNVTGVGEIVGCLVKIKFMLFRRFLVVSGLKSSFPKSLPFSTMSPLKQSWPPVLADYSIFRHGSGSFVKTGMNDRRCVWRRG